MRPLDSWRSRGLRFSRTDRRRCRATARSVPQTDFHLWPHRGCDATVGLEEVEDSIVIKVGQADTKPCIGPRGISQPNLRSLINEKLALVAEKRVGLRLQIHDQILA